MASSVYKVNKGINKPIEFRGLKAQYIIYLALGLVGLLIVFAVLYFTGVNMFVCLTVTILLGVMLFVGVYRLSDTYGQFGLVKKMACRNIPVYLKVSSRRVFVILKSLNHG